MPNKLTEAEIQKLIPLVEQTKWHYRLDKFTDESLGLINKSVNQARREVASKLAKINPESKFTKQRLETLAQELQDMTVAIQHKITGQIENTALEVAAKSYHKHADILSFGGLVPNFNAVQLTAAQLKSIVDTPIGGKLLNEWVDTSFTANIKDKFQEGIATGMLKGESYRNLVKRFKTEAFTGLEKDMEAITRTQVQSINTNAMKDTMMANADIMKGWKWNSVYENRTCIRCMSLDAKDEVYPIDGGPQIPLHVNCRCFPEPITKTFRELGVDIDEMKESYRPYTIRGKIDPVTGRVIPGKIGVGGGRIIETGRFLGNYDDFFKQLPENVQMQMLGPTRFGLHKAGKLPLSKLTDAKGNAFLIKELESGKADKILVSEVSTPKTASKAKKVLNTTTNFNEAEKLMRDLQSKIPIEGVEGNAIYEYTDEKFDSINNYLRGIWKTPQKGDLEMITNIDKFLKIAPKFETTSYRGISAGDRLFESYAKLKKGDVYVDKSYMSTSHQKWVMKDFVEKADKKIKIKINGKTGVLLDEYGSNIDEFEILFAKNTKFIVKDVIKDGSNTLNITLEELTEAKKASNVAKVAKKEAQVAKFILPSADDLSVKALEKNSELFNSLFDDFQMSEHVQKAAKKSVESKLKSRMAALSESDRADYELFVEHFKREFGSYGTPERDIIKKWARTSGDGDELATFMQHMAKEEFGLPDSVADHLLSRDLSQTLNTALENSSIKNGARKFLREMYNETQEQFAKKGIKELTLFRGAKLEEYTGLTELQPMSSFSTSIETARVFASELGNLKPTLLSVKVPVKSIIGTPASGYGCFDEFEAVTLGGKTDMLKITTSDLKNVIKGTSFTDLEIDEVLESFIEKSKKAARDAERALAATRHEAQRIAYYKELAEKEAKD